MVVASEHADAPVASFYESPSVATVVDVPLQRCRGLWFAAFPCGLGSDHPFIRTMVAFESGASTTYGGSPLEAYYDHWRPTSAAQALGLPETTGPLGHAPALAATAPWWPIHDVEAFAIDLEAGIEAENAENGAALPASAGSLLHGPVSPGKGALEFARCVKSFQSIRSLGFQRSSDTPDGDARGQVLVRDGGDYAVLVLNGQHRVAGAAAAGLTSVPVRFYDGTLSGSRIVHRADVEMWPAVRHGRLSAPQALHVFDRLFEGRPPWRPADTR